MKMITVMVLLVVFIEGTAYAGEFVKPDQWETFMEKMKPLVRRLSPNLTTGVDTGCRKATVRYR